MLNTWYHLAYKEVLVHSHTLSHYLLSYVTEHRVHTIQQFPNLKLIKASHKIKYAVHVLRRKDQNKREKTAGESLDNVPILGKILLVVNSCGWLVVVGWYFFNGLIILWQHFDVLHPTNNSLAALSMLRKVLDHSQSVRMNLLCGLFVVLGNETNTRTRILGALWKDAWLLLQWCNISEKFAMPSAAVEAVHSLAAASHVSHSLTKSSSSFCSFSKWCLVALQSSSHSSWPSLGSPLFTSSNRFKAFFETHSDDLPDVQPKAFETRARYCATSDGTVITPPLNLEMYSAWSFKSLSAIFSRTASHTSNALVLRIHPSWYKTAPGMSAASLWKLLMFYIVWAASRVIQIIRKCKHIPF